MTRAPDQLTPAQPHSLVARPAQAGTGCPALFIRGFKLDLRDCVKYFLLFGMFAMASDPRVQIPVYWADYTRGRR